VHNVDNARGQIRINPRDAAATLKLIAMHTELGHAGHALGTLRSFPQDAINYWLASAAGSLSPAGRATRFLG